MSSPRNHVLNFLLNKKFSYIQRKILRVNTYMVVYRQLGDSNSKWHKKLQKVPVGEGASMRKCQLGDRLEKFKPWTDDFFPIL